MHSVRSRAHKLAWKHEQGQTNYNPFSRTTSRKSSDIRSPDPELGTAGFATGRNSQQNGQPSQPRPSQDDISPTEKQGENSESKQSSDATMTNSNHDFAAQSKTNAQGGFESKHSAYNPLRGIDYMRFRNSKVKISVVQQMKALFLNSWINVMLILVPVGFALNYAKVNPIASFVINFLAIVPLAGMLSYSTEQLALFCGENLGGLLNATFGNAVELIVSIFALVDDKIVIVQTSLIGSMLSNLLLVLGMAFFLGGWSRVEQNFNDAIATTSPSLLAVAIGSLILPTAYHEFTGEGSVAGTLTAADVRENAKTLNPGVNELSRGTAILLLITYAGYLTFQLRTHKDYFQQKSAKSQPRKPSKAQQGDASTEQEQQYPEQSGSQEEEEEEEPEISLFVALIALTGVTVLVAFCSEFMVSGIDSVTKSGGISEVFVGLILIPIVGNAAEHATAVTVAIKDKITLSIGVAVGSSLQIALFVVPIMVCLGWWTGNNDMNLWFDGFQTTALFITVLLVNYLIADGKSNWLEGLLLIILYVIIAVAAFVSPDPETKTESSGKAA